LNSSAANPSETASVRSAGFTLLETLIALAIAAVGLGFLVSAAGTGLGNAELAGRYVEATRRAQSHLAEIGITTPLVPGVRSGDDGGGFSWTARISAPAGHETAEASTEMPALGLYTVEVTIRWREGVSVRSISLQSQRTGRS
jgi:prepilin-type N-terminal cleavage/methylation domain-containing protein